MSGSFFDTSILVYARDSSDARKQQRAASLVQAAFEAGTGRVSQQVLHEFYVSVTQKLKPGLSREEARRSVLSLRGWDPLVLDQALMASAWRLQDRHSFPFWDALIVAAALACDCETLYSEDLLHGQKIGGLRISNPFEEFR